MTLGRRARACFFALVATLAGGNAHANVLLTGPEAIDANTFKLFIELDQPLGFALDALQLQINPGTSLTQVGLPFKQPAVPGTYDAVTASFGGILYLEPGVLPTGKLFDLTFQGPIGAASDVNVTLTLFPTGDLPEVPFNPTLVPEPGTYALFATGLIGMAVMTRRRRLQTSKSVQA